MMEDIRIHIHDFGPLHEVRFQLAPMMIFTGMSSLGKSYANYVTYYTISSISGELLGRIVLSKTGDKPTEPISFEITTDEISSALHNEVEAFMQSFLGDDNLRCNVDFIIGGEKSNYFTFKKVEDQDITGENGDSISFQRRTKWECSHNGKKLSFYSNTANVLANIQFVVNNRICVSLFDSLLSFTPILPPARGAFVGENYSMKSKVSSSLGMYRQFLNDYDQGVQPSDKIAINDDSEEFFKKAVEKLLDGQLVNEKDKQYLRMSNGKQISLTAAASSIKELSPFLFFLKNYIGNYMSFCFEEPEAHLHPKMQVALAELIAASLRMDMLFQITTHSDYFLQRINQLIKLGYLKERNKDKFNEICEEWKLDKECYIESKKVKAYYFHRDEDGMVIVEDMPLGKDGIPFKSFFEVANELQLREDEINNALYELSEKEDEA